MIEQKPHQAHFYTRKVWIFTQISAANPRCKEFLQEINSSTNQFYYGVGYCNLNIQTNPLMSSVVK